LIEKLICAVVTMEVDGSKAEIVVDIGIARGAIVSVGRWRHI